MTETHSFMAQERASTLPLAFILFFAVAFIGLNIYQLHYVPQQGLEEEIESNRALLQDVQEFDFAVRQMLFDGQPQPVTVGQPVNYPISFPTPPDPTFVASTTENESIQIKNYKCQSGNCKSESNTTTVLFLGNYNYLKNDRVYGYEYGIVYSAPNKSPEGSSGVVTYNDQFIIQGNVVTLVAFQGDFSYERKDVVSTTLKPDQAPSYNYVITNSSEAVNITLPTELSEGRWENLMEDQTTENGGHITNITYKNYTTVKDSSDKNTGNANQEHWESCDSSGDGRPFIDCTIDNSTNYVTFTMEPSVNYTVQTEIIGIGD